MTTFEGWKIPQIDTATQQTLSDKTVLLHNRLITIASRFPNARFASSLAIEDMVITDVIAKLQLPISIFTLNTGRLNPETESLITQITNQYHLTIDVMHPDPQAVKTYVMAHGTNAFYENTILRKNCCYIRKVEPLKRALSSAKAWLTGQRREQSVTRDTLIFEQFDHDNNLIKFNPIYDWQEQDIWAYALTHHVPINPLYYKSYPSIGCEPCTKPVRLGEDIRSGRWWWETQDNKECGLHQHSSIDKT